MARVYFKLNYNGEGGTPRSKSNPSDTKVEGSGNRMSVTIGAPPEIPKGMRIPNPHEGIRQVGGGSSSSGGDGWLAERFHRK